MFALPHDINIFNHYVVQCIPLGVNKRLWLSDRLWKSSLYNFHLILQTGLPYLSSSVSFWSYLTQSPNPSINLFISIGMGQFWHRCVIMPGVSDMGVGGGGTFPPYWDMVPIPISTFYLFSCLFITKTFNYTLFMRKHQLRGSKQNIFH